MAEAPILSLVVALGLLASSPPALPALPPSSAADAPLALREDPALVIEQQPERYEDRWDDRKAKKKNTKRHNFARVVFWVGAAWDVYTTKHGLDAGLTEGNPFATPFANNPNWLTLALPKAIAYAAFELVGRRGWTKTRDALLLSTGYAQMAVGFSNLDLLQAREAASEPEAPVEAAALPSIELMPVSTVSVPCPRLERPELP